MNATPASGGSTVVLRGALAAFAATVSIAAACGFAGHLSFAMPILLALGFVTVAWRVRRLVVSRAPALPVAGADGRARLARLGVASTPPASPFVSPLASALGAAIAVALLERLATGVTRDTFLYDVLSYHLHLPLTWRAADRLLIVPTPFGDQAPAYAPANVELIYALVIGVTRNVVWVHAGQVLFAALAMLAIHATARELGAKRETSLAAALAFLLVPEIWQQSASAMSDLALAAFFLSALPFLLRLERSSTARDAAAAGLALGLLTGTKHVGLLLALPLAIWTVIAIGRRGPWVARAGLLAAVGGLMLASGAFWYVRNTVATGNPLFPVTLEIAGRQIAPGLYGTATMRDWIYHAPITDFLALAALVADVGWAFGAAAVLAVLAGWRSRWPALALAFVGYVWLVVPYQHARFLFAAWGLAAIALAAAETQRRRTATAGLALATVGSIIEYPTAGRLVLMVAAVVAYAAAWALIPVVSVVEGRSRRAPRRATFAILAVALAGVGAATVFSTWLLLRARSPAPYAIGDHHDAGWAWIGAHARGRRIAYAGSNLPVPLWGRHIANTVFYANVAGPWTAVAHHFAQTVPAANIPGATTAEPAPERAVQDQRAWRTNLSALRIDLLFVSRLYPTVADTIQHDDDAFPVERQWADADPTAFRLAFAGEGVRIYELSLGARAIDQR